MKAAPTTRKESHIASGDVSVIEEEEAAIVESGKNSSLRKMQSLQRRGKDSQAGSPTGRGGRLFM